MLTFTNTRWTAALVAFASGAVFSLAFAPYYYWPVIFICIPLLYILLSNLQSDGQGMLRGFAFGYGFFMAGTWWIGNALLVDAEKFGWMLPFCILGLSAVMALWFMFFGLFCYYLRNRMSPLVFALLWLVCELLRSIGMFGFPWNLAGYISLAALPFAQLASVVGVYGLSLLVVWIGLLPTYWMMERLRPKARSVSAVALMIFVVWCGFGVNRLASQTSFTDTQLRIVQPNIPQEVKGTPEGEIIAARLLGEGTEQKTEGKAADIVLWPETAYPYTLRENKGVLLPNVRGVLLTGAVRAEGYRPQIKIWNSLVALSMSGTVLATYDKHQLVPFGEFMPLRSVLPLHKITPGDIDFSRGIGPQTTRVPGVPPFSPQVCYEGIFPWLAVDSSDRPAWMLNVTNDAWYGMTAGPYQHFDMVRMRAIEQGLPLVRAANNGISAVVDAQGRITKKLDLGARGIIETPLPAAHPPTPYSRIF